MRQLDELEEERLSLAAERIGRICTEQDVPEACRPYFAGTAQFVTDMLALAKRLESGETRDWTLEQWREQNRAIYADILPDAYAASYGNPEYAVKMLGEVHGRILSFLYAELRGMIVYAFEQRWEELLILMELFIEVYNCFEGDELPGYREIQQIVYWHLSDYCDLTVTRRVREAVDPELDFAVKIIREEDLTDLRYLYKFGEYINESVLQTARFLNTLPREEIERIASVFTEGYRIGFVVGNKDLSKKKTVNIRFVLGFEQIIREAIRQFERMGLQPVIYRSATHSVNKRQQYRIGYYGAIPNPQFEYDHKDDASLYLDRAFMERKLGVMRSAYAQYQELANAHGGPACMETFGEMPFVPRQKEAAYRLSEKQQKLSVEMASETVKITNQYIIGEERSFTIIAFPVPEIGERFEEIFEETVKLNTLDYQQYQRIQQTMIDTLDQGRRVHIRGQAGNRTELWVSLMERPNPEKQTIFENCVADVNIPVGEVFTSPRLAGTNGVLHVSQVYLNGLCYRDLELTFRDGCVADYRCANFASDEENRAYIRENVLYHHDTLPMGEFAVGTNTTAYAMAEKFGIQDRLPILIAEKTGPHFAVGDTCYSWAEDVPVYNPDGKEIISRDNEISILRKTDPEKAYFGCHTDITIPYRELGLLAVELPDGREIPIIEKGRFVLPGTEELNAALEQAV